MELAAQLDLLAQGRNFEEWGDFLVIAIMAILWLAGAVVKTIGSRKRAQPQSQQGDASKPRRPRTTWQERLVRKVEEMQRAAEAQAGKTSQGRRSPGETPQPQPTPAAPPAGRVRVRTGPKGDSLIVFERPPSTGATERKQQTARYKDVRKAVTTAGQQAARSPAVEPRIETTGPGSEPIIKGMVGTMREPPGSLEPGALRSRTTRESASFQPSALIDYDDPDALMKAILHYEILGKPLALRESSDEPSSF